MKKGSTEVKKADGNTDKAKNRYSDEELEEFRQIILDKLVKANNDLDLLTESYTTGNDHDTNDTSPTFKVLEEGYQVFSKEENSKFAARQSKFIKALENALVRIENKSYGICRATGKLIPKDRLRIVPHATLSIEAKRQQVTVVAPPMKQMNHNLDNH
ncbi:MAG TPA: TraR/DksA C4-type zinc finger protein [Bacteroidales bacterium]|nr:TraR/DksA C4-type zinc finger protein [Bacteroidales bacterium]